jgi:predicted enzyme related to lactoylglutathione lyase
MNPVSYFEIPVLDIERAVAFYRAVFGFDFEEVNIAGNDMALFPHADGTPGISGALVKGGAYSPGNEGARVYFTVDRIQPVLTRAVAAGGRVLQPETSIGNVALVAEIEDGDGNCIALYASPD